jgi:probable HAF family extracellular repeat protein
MLVSLLLVLGAATTLQAANMYTATFICGSSNYPSRATAINASSQVVGGCEQPWQIPGYEWTSLDTAFITYTNSPGVPFMFPGGLFFNAVNDGGQAVGTSLGVATSVYSNEAVACEFGTTSSAAYGINNSGQIVGQVQNSQAFLCSGSTLTLLGFLPGGSSSQANGIDNNGQVVGQATNATGHTEAFLYTGQAMIGLGTLPGYTDSVATAINDQGQIVGYATDAAGNTQAFLYSNGVMTGLGALPGDSQSRANAINNKGQIVGSSRPPVCSSGPCYRAVLYSGGQMIDLNALTSNAAALTEATGINDSGQISANSSFTGEAFLLTPAAGRFIPVPPCRVADTRGGNGPALAPGVERSFLIPQGVCNIAATPLAYSLNVTAVPQGQLNYLTIWPTGTPQPLVSTLNSFDGGIVANAAIVAAGPNGAISLYTAGLAPTDVVLDINGYFASSTGDAFYPTAPCRVSDTRLPNGPLGGPAFSIGEIRSIPIPSAPCNLAATAGAYSANVTVVPQGYLGYLTIWPTGQAQPYVSTLNSPNGSVLANAAIIPAGTNGAASVYVTNPTDVILDANGYFALPGNPGGLSFYPVLPCRVADTRNDDGPFGGPEIEGGASRSFAIPSSACGIPSTAAAYSLNITAIPDGPLYYLTAWPTGSTQPFVSTLNSMDGALASNAAIVAAGTNGAVSIYVQSQSAADVVIDIDGYFAP